MSDPDKSLANARKLRKNMTFPERRLWYAIRNRNLAGIKFRRQTPLLGFVVDYLCAEHALILELDGKSHIGRYEYDLDRQQKLEAAGFRVLRFDNDEVLRDLEAVLGAILLACGKTPR
jgi:very-short-patch-repair endonuclease